jgi:hypothetical protein
MSFVVRTIVAAFTVFAGSSVQAQHRLVAQGNDNLVLIGRDGKAEWQMPWGEIHDVHILPNFNIATSWCSKALAKSLRLTAIDTRSCERRIRQSPMAMPAGRCKSMPFSLSTKDA